MDICLDRANTLATFVRDEQRIKEIYPHIVDRYMTEGNPRAATFAVSANARCKSYR